MLSTSTLRCRIYAASLGRAAELEQETLSLHRLHPKSLNRVRPGNQRCFISQPWKKSTENRVIEQEEGHDNGGSVLAEERPQKDPRPRRASRQHGRWRVKNAMTISEYRSKYKSLQQEDEANIVRKVGGPRNKVHSQATIEPDKNSDAIFESVLPRSPLERCAGTKSAWEPSKEYIKGEAGSLAGNPWAVMLSSPIRQDSGSSVRFPRRLLMQFSPMKNPNDGHVYLLPDRVADLGAFNKTLQSCKKLKPNSSGRTEALVRLIPYRALLDDLATSTRKWDDAKQEWTTKGRGKGIAAKVLPHQTIDHFEKYEGFRRASQEFWTIKEIQGELDDDAFKPPEAYADLAQTQWDNNIAARLVDLLRQRVLLTLKKLIQRDDRNHRGLYNTITVDLPQLPCDLVEILPELKALDEVDLWNDMGDIEAPGAIAGSASATDSRPPIAIPPDEIDVPPSGNVPRKWLPGSIILHTGPVESVLPAVLTSTNGSSKHLPPLMSVAAGRYRLPIFNMRSMLGPVFMPYFVKILRDYPSFMKSISVSESASDETLLGDRIILVKGVATLSSWLTEELWQLWRYVGGTDCFNPESKDPLLELPEHVNPQKAGEALKKSLYNRPTAALLKHFEELLSTDKGRDLIPQKWRQREER